MLERYEVKVSCTVLREEGNRKVSDLPDGILVLHDYNHSDFCVT